MTKLDEAIEYAPAMIGTENDVLCLVPKHQHDELLQAARAYREMQWRPYISGGGEQAVFGRNVLLLYPDGHVQACNSDGRFWRTIRKGNIPEQGYTDWMPLPQPPQKGEMK